MVVLAALAAGASLAVSLTSDPVYRASMKIVVGQGGGVFQPAFGSSVQPFTQTMTNLLESNVVAQAAVDRVQSTDTADEVLRRLDVTSAPDSSVLVVTYDDPDGARAVQMLAVIGDEFTRLVDRSLGTGSSSTQGTPQVTARVFDPPHQLEGQVSPRPVRDAVLAALLGVALGLVLAFGLEALDDRLRSRRDAETWFGARVIGTIPRRIARLGPQAAVAALTGPGRRREHGLAMDVLVANTAMLAPAAATPIVGVTSARHGDGQGLVACALARGLAATGRRVILVDADRARPAAPRHFTLGPGPSLLDVLAGDVPVEGALRPALFDDIAGGEPVLTLTSPPTGMDAPARVAEPLRPIFGRLRAMCDVVVVNLPPALASVETMALMPSLDGVVIVARHGVTRRADAEAVHELTAGMRAEALAVVITDSDARPRLTPATARWPRPAGDPGLPRAVDPSRT